MEDILDKWVHLNQIDVHDIPIIAEHYLTVVRNESSDSELIQKLMASGAFQLMDWNKALRDIAVCMNYNLEFVYDQHGRLINRIHIDNEETN